MKSGRGRRSGRGDGAPSERTTLMYDYTIILLEPLHRSSLSVSSPQPQNSFHRQIFHFSPSVLFAFLVLFLFVHYHCELSGRGLSLSVLSEPTLINCISVCRSIKCSCTSFSFRVSCPCFGSSPRLYWLLSLLPLFGRLAHLFLDPNPTGLCFLSRE